MMQYFDYEIELVRGLVQQKERDFSQYWLLEDILFVFLLLLSSMNLIHNSRKIIVALGVSNYINNTGIILAQE